MGMSAFVEVTKHFLFLQALSLPHLHLIDPGKTVEREEAVNLLQNGNCPQWEMCVGRRGDSAGLVGWRQCVVSCM